MPARAYAAPFATGFPLAPLQHGMLVHHSRAAVTGVDVEQIVCTLTERIDRDALRRAWRTVVDAHAALRTVFQWRDVENPMQRTVDAVPLELDHRALLEVPAPERDAVIARFLQADRARGFDLEVAPLMRVALFEFADDDARLIWTFHHILLDGRAFATVLEQVFAAYECECRGATFSPPPARPYATYVEWLATRDGAAADTFWRQALAGVTSATPLPLRRAPDAAAEDGLRATSADREARLSESTTTALDALARAHGLSLGTLVQGAWALVLGRYAGTDDVVFGAVLACDDYARDEGAREEAGLPIGLYINTIPLRVAVPEDATLGAWLADVRARWTALRAHKHTPLARIQAASGIARGAPLFESIVMFERYELEERLQALGGAWARRRVRLYEQNGFPLTLAAYAGRALLLRLEYDPTQYAAEDVQVLVERVTCVLEAFATGGLERRVADVDMMRSGERATVVERWNATEVAYPPDETLVTLLDAQARRTPQAPAVVAEGATLTFAELDQRATRLAHYLRTRGVRRNTLVGVALERSVELVVALVAVLKAGGAYVPLDPEYPQERLAFMLDDSAVPVLLTTSLLRDRVAPASRATPARPMEVVCLDTDWDAPGGRIADATAAADAETDAAAAVVGPDDLAYMIYTSGSTGTPKGALNTHRGIVNRLCWMQQRYGLTGRDVVLQKTPASFDVSVWEFFWPLISGARLVLAAPGGHRDAAYLCELIQRERVTVLHFVPSMLRAFLEEPGVDCCGAGAGGPVREVICSGEALAPDLVERTLARLPGTRLHNLYGPTECAVDVTAWTCGSEDVMRPTVPIGRPIANTQLYVLDAHGAPTPIGVAGELYIGGVQVGVGYWRRPELTAERFVADPFRPSVPGARLYRTGDRARWRADGTLEYLGRTDQQVKLRGFRIELGEIESALTHEPEIAAAAVLMREDVPGAPQLVAYCVGATGDATGSALSATLRERLRARIPAHMVPSAIVWLPALPLNASGKLDRRALPAPAVDETAPRRADIVLPRTPVEATLAEIFAATLHRDVVGVNDDFFELGGDSLLLIQVVAKARAAGLLVTLRQVFKHPTVATLAAVATAAESAEAARCAVSGTSPLTPIQRWFFEGIGAEPDHWNQAVLLTTPAPLDAVALRTALGAVLAHHDALRLRFTRRAGGWEQSYSDPGDEVPFAVLDLDAAADVDTAVAEACERAQRSLRITEGPLVRAVYMRGRAGAARLLVVVHHLAVDGVSWRILIEDLEAAYHDAVQGHTPRLPVRTSSYREWAEHLVAFADSEDARTQTSYWRDVLHAGPMRLPRDMARDSKGVAANTRTVTAWLTPDETTALLQRVPATYGTQVNDVLLAALGTSFHEWVSRDAFVVDVESHGREDLHGDVDVSRTVGWFTAIHPAVLDVRPLDGVVESLRLMEERRHALPQRGIGYGVLRYLRAEPALASDEPRDVVFNYLGRAEQLVAGSRLFALADGPTGALRGPATPRRYLLEINGLVRDGRLAVTWEYDGTVHRAETIEGVAQRFTDALRAVVASCAGTAPAVASSTIPDEIEDSYPLTPIQRLFHLFGDADGDPGFEQWRFRIAGHLHAGRLRDAWQAVVDRHPMLRTEIVTAEDGEPRQRVRRRVTVRWTEVDLRGAPDRERELGALLDADRVQGISFDRAPLMRIALVRLADTEWELVWTHHHLLLDRWSWPLVLREVGAAYEAIVAGATPVLPPVVPFGRYVRWLDERDESQAEAFWRASLEGMSAPPRLHLARTDVGADGAAVQAALTLTEQETSALRELAKTLRVTLNTVVQGAWALLLSHLLDADDFALGVVVSGRPADLAGVQEIVGVMINDVPARVRVAPDEAVRTWLHRLADEQSALQEHGWAPLERIQAWSGHGQRLFDNLIVFQHAAADDIAHGWLRGDARVTGTVTPTGTQYPLTLVVGGSATLRLSLVSDDRYLTVDAAEQLLSHVRVAMLAMVGRGDARVADILARLQATDRGTLRGAPSAMAHHATYVAPASALEEVLGRAWADLLDVERVGATDNFFALGGHSLAAMRVMAYIFDTFQMNVPVRALFSGPTVAQLATTLRVHEPRRGYADQVAELLQRVERMSSDEVELSLAGRADAGANGMAHS